MKTKGPCDPQQPQKSSPSIPHPPRHDVILGKLERHQPGNSVSASHVRPSATHLTFLCLSCLISKMGW